MDQISVTLKVFFEGSFWIGLFERIENNQLSVSKVIFGNEPKDYEIYDFVLKKYYQLQFSPSVQTINKKTHMNPKRQVREIKKEMQDIRLGTKSQQALKLQYEQRKKLAKQMTKEQRKSKKELLFELKKQKKKNKHKGR